MNCWPWCRKSIATEAQKLARRALTLAEHYRADNQRLAALVARSLAIVKSSRELDDAEKTLDAADASPRWIN